MSYDLLNRRSVVLDDQEHGDWTFYYVITSPYEYDDDNAPSEPEEPEELGEDTEGASELPNATAPTGEEGA
ncbi:hypothetical protein FRC06_001253 [Ceratobasidium sp. 370]|nr:hypothetical protein FRC06_001253 [Ceratobasidium sp. 370]